jgi:hypothetical protein
MPKLPVRNVLAFASCLLAGLVSQAAFAAPPAALNTSMSVQGQIDKAAAESQNKIDKLSDQAQDMLQQYLLTTQETERLKVYNEQLEKLIHSQEEEKISIKKQLQDVEVVEMEIIPLMVRMIDTLDQFVHLDVPFLMKERTDRVQTLRELMDRADVTISEKYRRVMEAYQIETDYGRNMEAYRGELAQNGKKRTVDFLRVGRILLAYQTLDRSETGFWNKNTKKWEVLPDSYRQAITKGLAIARKQTAPELLKLPVPAPERAK